jgi:hypothetical protein
MTSHDLPLAGVMTKYNNLVDMTLHLVDISIYSANKSYQ